MSDTKAHLIRVEVSLLYTVFNSLSLLYAHGCAVVPAERLVLRREREGKKDRQTDREREEIIRSTRIQRNTSSKGTYHITVIHTNACIVGSHTCEASLLMTIESLVSSARYLCL